MIKLVVLISTVFFGQAAIAQLTYPQSRAGDEAVVMHGVSVPDRYRWLEALDTQEVKDWRDKQNDLAVRALGNQQLRKTIKEQLEKLNAGGFQVPDLRERRLVWIERERGMEQTVLKTKLLDSNSESIAVDGNTLSSDGSVSIAGFVISPDGSRLLVLTRSKGIQQFSMFVKSLEDNQEFAEVIRPTGTAGSLNIGWVNGNAGFFYVRRITKHADGERNIDRPYDAIYYHRVGTDQSKDVHVFGDESHAKWKYSPSTSRDGDLLTVRFWEKTSATNGILLIPLEKGIPQLSKKTFLKSDFDSKNVPLGTRNGKLLLLTFFGAKTGRIVEVDPAQPESDRWKVLVKESTHAIDEAKYLGGKLVVLYTVNAVSAMSVYSIDGTHEEHIKLPGIGATGPISGEPHTSKMFFAFTSINQPPSIYELDLNTYKYEMYKESRVRFDSAKYEVKLELVRVRDGTQVPVFIAYRKGLAKNGSTPLILYGYGGFGVTMGSAFGVPEAAWLEMGGAVAIAGVRGGGEFGERWHEGGKLLNKRNSIQDFVDVAQWLVDTKYTQSRRIGIIGESAGGLLVSAAINSRPDLFGAAINSSGLTDMIRNESAKTSFNWTNEFGTVEREADFINLLSYSPVHNITPNVEYPAVLVTAGELDDRVVPWHQYKQIAALQNSNTGKSPKLLRVAYGVGHGFGKTASAVLEDRVDKLVFFADTLGLAAELKSKRASLAD